MKVLYVTNLPSPYKVDFLNELGKKVDLTVVFERQTASNRNKEWKALETISKFKEIILKGYKIGEESSISFELIKLISSSKYEVIVINGYSSPTMLLTILYLYIKKIDFIMSIDGGFILSESKAKFLFKKFFINKAKLWLSPGHTSTEYLIHYGARSRDIISYPFTSIRKSEIQEDINYKKDIYREKLNIKYETVVLAIGQFIYRKGYDILINASKDLPESVGVYIIGGRATDEYINLIDELEITNVHFVDFKPQNQLKEYFLAADFFVHPTREDIWGLVINEAMSFGLPVITTNRCVAGLDMVEQGLNGYIIPVDNYEELHLKMLLLIENKKQLYMMRNNCLLTISKYTIEEMAKRHFHALEKFVEDKNK